MKCQNCGNEITDNQKFCSNCGKEFQIKPKNKRTLCNECYKELIKQKDRERKLLERK